MAFKQVVDLDADTTVALGGVNKKTKRANPTEVEGYYLGARQVESKKSKTGYCSIHYFQTAEGNLAVWGKTDLDRKLGNITPGSMVRAAFDKMQGTPNGEMYKYKVEFDPDNTIDVGTLASGSSKAAPESTNDADSSDDGSDNDTLELQLALEAEAAARAAKVQELLSRGKSAKK